MPSPGVKARINRFWRAVKRLEYFKNYSREEFVSNEDLIDSCERNLQVAIEALIDVGEALISNLDWRTPKSYREIGVILKENGVLTNSDLKYFVKLVKIRNILIHSYVYISPERVYEITRKYTTILTVLMKKIINFMNRAGIDP